MATYYCHHCALSNSYIIPANPITLTGTLYQLGKFIKHTIPSSSYGTVSVFDEPSYENYSNYFVGTIASGCLEIDDLGRRNIIYYAGERTGVEYANGVFIIPTSGIKVVLAEDGNMTHAFPITSSPGNIVYCAICGVPIPLW